MVKTPGIKKLYLCINSKFVSDIYGIICRSSIQYKQVICIFCRVIPSFYKLFFIFGNSVNCYQNFPLFVFFIIMIIISVLLATVRGQSAGSTRYNRFVYELFSQFQRRSRHGTAANPRSSRSPWRPWSADAPRSYWSCPPLLHPSCRTEDQRAERWWGSPNPSPPSNAEPGQSCRPLVALLQCFHFRR